VRPLSIDDLNECHRLFIDIGWASGIPEEEALETRRRWLAWTVQNYEQLALLGQPPYGERAIVRRDDQCFVGLVGLVPLLAPFGMLPSFGGREAAAFSAEVGLFWAVCPRHQGQGIATEAAQMMIDYAFEHLHLGRILAATETDNAASVAVMRRLGMHVERNPFSHPTWFQVVAHLDRSSL